MKIFKCNNYLQINFSDGRVYTTENCTEDLVDFLLQNADDEQTILNKFFPTCPKDILEDRIKNSEILVIRGSSVYMPKVSQLSIPQDFVEKILVAEENQDEAELQKYINFWRLVSLNPDSRVRDNMFWFIRKWDMQITESGLIRAYRNADIKEETQYTAQECKEIIHSYYKAKYLKDISLEDEMYAKYGKSLKELYDIVINGGIETPTFTDHHSHTFTIKLGQPVRMPREEVDAEQEHSCSQGLHVGAKSWLKQNYFGNVGLAVLVNPAHVCAVPTIDDYGKMRVCEYFPIAVIDFDENGDIVEPEYTLHDDIEYLKQIHYDGDINNDDIAPYSLSSHNNLTREEIYEQILDSIDEC